MLMDYYSRMYAGFGPQNWWPARTRFEVVVGAILTQNTAWTNVERAISSLKGARLLTPERMHRLRVDVLAGHIKSAGYFNVKAKRLKNFTTHLFSTHGGSLARLLGRTNGAAREELLGINGIGPETADSILLYAGSSPEFVVDAYTKRIFSRHGFVDEDAGYEETKALFMENLDTDVELMNEYHALIVMTGKEFCRPRRPLCGQCPLNECL